MARSRSRQGVHGLCLLVALLASNTPTAAAALLPAGRACARRPPLAAVPATPLAPLGSLRAPLELLTRDDHHRRCVPPRLRAPRGDEVDDTLVLYGDAAACMVYGAVQGLTDGLLAPLAAAQPELFTNATPLPLPLLQGTVLALAWVAACAALGGYRPEVTRSRGAPAVRSCLGAWALSTAGVLGALWALQAGAGLGPGVGNDEVSFVTGSLTVVGAWRLVVVAAGPTLP